MTQVCYKLFYLANILHGGSCGQFYCGIAGIHIYDFLLRVMFHLSIIRCSM